MKMKPSGQRRTYYTCAALPQDRRLVAVQNEHPSHIVGVAHPEYFLTAEFRAQEEAITRWSGVFAKFAGEISREAVLSVLLGERLQ